MYVVVAQNLSNMTLPASIFSGLLTFKQAVKHRRTTASLYPEYSIIIFKLLYCDQNKEAL